MNRKSCEFLKLIATTSVSSKDAYAFFGGKYEFLNQQLRHFPTMVEWTSSGDHIILTYDGKDFVESQEELHQRQKAEAEQHASDEAKSISDRKKQFRHDWRVSVISAMVGAILTLIVEHFQAVLAFLREAFH